MDTLSRNAERFDLNPSTEGCKMLLRSIQQHQRKINFSNSEIINRWTIFKMINFISVDIVPELCTIAKKHSTHQKKLRTVANVRRRIHLFWKLIGYQVIPSYTLFCQTTGVTEIDILVWITGYDSE